MMKKLSKIGIVVIVMAMVCSLAVGCSGKKEEASGDKVYKIATDTTFAPFEFQDEKGEFVGIDMDLLKAIAEDQGFKYEVQVVGFNAAVQSLESNQSDGVIAGMSITDERKEKFDFSTPYFDSGVILAVKSDSTIEKLEDLKGQKVAVKTGTEGYDYANSIKDKYGFELTVLEDSANMYEDVKAGNSVACCEDYPVIGYAITQGQPFKTIGEKSQGSSYGFAVAKGQNAELLSMFNAGLENLKKSGKYDEILAKYGAK